MPDPENKPTPPPESNPPAKPADDSAPAGKEEQMERYEEYLKENDWGHQPC